MAKKFKSSADQRSERFQMRLSPNFVKEIDEWRRKQPDLPSRNEAIIRLVEQAISGTDAAKTKGGKK